MKYLCILIVFLLPVQLLFAEEAMVSAKQAEFQFTFEDLTLHEFKDETMGLMGANLLFQLDGYPWLFVGGASYGSLTGARGGFITLGLTSDIHFDLNEQLSTHANVFMGAGGGHGGYQLQGGGLMLRGSVGISSQHKIGNFGLGVSHVNFPNGHVVSNQIYGSYQYQFQSLIGHGWLDTVVGSQEEWEKENDHLFSLVYRQYVVPNGALASSGQLQHKTVGLVGVEWQQALNDWSFVSIESEGAMIGRSNGYMQTLFGGGVYQQLTQNLRVDASMHAGMAGGGNVDTGGGLLVGLKSGLQLKVSHDFGVTLEAGVVRAPMASFKAVNYGLKINSSFATPAVDLGESVSLSKLYLFDVEHMRIRFTQQTYMATAASRQKWRAHHANRDVNLLGIQSDYFLNNNFFISGQGIAAYEGQAGGYMTGLVGGGFRYRFFDKWAFESEALVGAAGGGGLAVGGGLVWQVNSGINYAAGDAYEVLLQAGHMASVKGQFAANVISLSAGYQFSFFMK